jgi:hypothetical protein
MLSNVNKKRFQITNLNLQNEKNDAIQVLITYIRTQ